MKLKVRSRRRNAMAGRQLGPSQERWVRWQRSRGEGHETSLRGSHSGRQLRLANECGRSQRLVMKLQVGGVADNLRAPTPEESEKFFKCRLLFVALSVRRHVSVLIDNDKGLWASGL